MLSKRIQELLTIKVYIRLSNTIQKVKTYTALFSSSGASTCISSVSQLIGSTVDPAILKRIITFYKI